MATAKVLKIALWLLSIPHLGMSLLLELCNLDSVKRDLQLCLKVAGRFGNSAPPQFVEALRAAEDHRNMLHPGIDPVAIMRVLWVRVIFGRLQGASTIEQQFVRVVTGRYERTFRRKLREQMLALMLSRRLNKAEISSAYLSVAFYGYGCKGLTGLKKIVGDDLCKVEFNEALKIIAQLKYPRPRVPTLSWQSKLNARLQILQERTCGVANNPIQRKFARPLNLVRQKNCPPSTCRLRQCNQVAKSLSSRCPSTANQTIHRRA